MTLIELMIVVAIIGILASVAVFMFRKSTSQAQIKSEVASMFAEFQLRQENFHLENGVYASSNAANDEGTMHPSTPSAGLKQANLLGPGMPAQWTALGINTDKQSVYCSYVAVAGLANDDTNRGTIAQNDFGFDPIPATNWYYLLAECDADGDSTTNSFYFTRSDVEGLSRINEGN